MKAELPEILSTIADCVDRYRDQPLNDVVELSEILRTLTSYLYYLEVEKVKYHNDWLSYVYNSKATSQSAKASEADQKAPELYQCRKISEAGQKVCDALRSNISLFKNVDRAN
jgi:predicted transcriptional regulator